MAEITFDHIAIGAPRLDDAADFLAGQLGGKPGFGGPQADYRFWNWNYPGGGRLEVLEPAGPPGGFLQRFLERNGAGIHHVTFDVTDLDGICARAKAMGHHVLFGREDEKGFREAFLHPKTAMGIVVQFHGPAGPEHAKSPKMRGAPPPDPPAADPPARILGVRLRAADREKALRQWGELLQGQAEQDRPDELIFRWPEPGAEQPGMRVRILLGDDEAERSDAIEIANPPRDIPGGPHPVLGARFEVLQSP